jgi:branched-chain amino acid transport system substrate-binding protein
MRACCSSAPFLRRSRRGSRALRNSALRDALEGTKGLVATPGVYNMTPADHSGFDRRGRVLPMVGDGKWALPEI